MTPANLCFSTIERPTTFIDGTDVEAGQNSPGFSSSAGGGDAALLKNRLDWQFLHVRGLSVAKREQTIPNMLYTFVVVLVILWLLGFSFHVAGGLIHLILVIAVVLLAIQLLTGRRGL